MISNFCKTIGLFLYYQHVVKFLRDLFSILSSNTLNKIVFSVQIDLVFVHLTHRKISFYQSFMTNRYANFDQHPTSEVRANFLDISKDFDKVWHEGLLFKLQHIGISENRLSIIKRSFYDHINAKKMNSGAIKWTSHTKHYKELGLESLKFRRWIRRLYTYFEVKTSGKPEYIINLILTGQHSYNTQSLDQMEIYYTEILSEIIFSLHNSWAEQTQSRYSKLEILFNISECFVKNCQPYQCSVNRIHNPMG